MKDHQSELIDETKAIELCNENINKSIYYVNESKNVLKFLQITKKALTDLEKALELDYTNTSAINLKD